jgi:hypothetical protein
MKNIYCIYSLPILIFLLSSNSCAKDSTNTEVVTVNEPVTIGAIRWDAWFTDPEVVNPYEKALCPIEWHGRLPFYSRIISDTLVEVRGDTQEAVDQEIAYAKAGGIDYWAFLYYSNTVRDDGFKHDYMNRARRLYLSSKHKSDIHFCLIINPRHSGSEINEFLDMMQEPTYQKVADGRPLLYIRYWDPTHTPSAWFGSNENCRTYMDNFRAKIVAQGLKTPYCVVLTQSPEGWRNVAIASGMDAISAYTSWGGSNYTQMHFAHIAYWNRMKATGIKVVPNMTAGWGGPQDSNGDTMQPTPDELSTHLRAGYKWIDTNPDVAESKTMLFYAWNEVAEGGWLVPDKGQGPARLEAIRKVVDERKKSK